MPAATEPPKDEIVVMPSLPTLTSLDERSESDSEPMLRASAIFCAPSAVTSMVTESDDLRAGLALVGALPDSQHLGVFDDDFRR